jgi:hypothetical protein
MDMSPACTMPSYDRGTTSNRQHPRWADYQRYQSAMIRQMVQGASFARWLESTEEFENGRLTVFDPLPSAQLVKERGMGWYVNQFLPRRRDCITHGPFPSREAAEEFRP